MTSTAICCSHGSWPRAAELANAAVLAALTRGLLRIRRRSAVVRAGRVRVAGPHGLAHRRTWHACPAYVGYGDERREPTASVRNRCRPREASPTVRRCRCLIPLSRRQLRPAPRVRPSGRPGESLGSVFRNPNLRRVQLALAGSMIGDWAYATAVAVWAYGVGGLLRHRDARLPRKTVMIGADLIPAAGRSARATRVRAHCTSW